MHRTMSRNISNLFSTSMRLTDNQRKFQEFIQHYSNILVLTGAGVSTDSGIPDYRSQENGMFVKTSYKPIQYSDFMKKPGARKRFWARNFAAWPKFSSFKPNRIHFFISCLQGFYPATQIITQNVDGLHWKAGSSDVLELHGNAFWVRCTSCQNIVSRHDFQSTLEAHNPKLEIPALDLRPDADVEIPEESIINFEVPNCENCKGIMKPTVVFFGQSVPEKTAKKAEQMVNECDAILILGTTLSTLSAFRLVEQAYETGKYICLINSGPSKGDKLADLRLSCKLNEAIFNVPANNYV